MTSCCEALNFWMSASIFSKLAAESYQNSMVTGALLWERLKQKVPLLSFVPWLFVPEFTVAALHRAGNQRQMDNLFNTFIIILLIIRIRIFLSLICKLTLA
jgi:hypothetical protein